MRQYHPARGLRFFSSLVLLSTLVVPAAPAMARPATPEELCAPFLEPYLDNNLRIDAHNARPHVFPDTPSGRAQGASYNEEAVHLSEERARFYDNWQLCMEVLDELRNGKPSDLNLHTIADRSRATEATLAAASAKVPKDFAPPAPPPPGQGWQVPADSPLRPLFDRLRPSAPGRMGTPVLNGQARPNVGDPDPAYPGDTIQARSGGDPNVSADHIVPLAELVSMRDFWKLSPKFQYMMARVPFNYQWLSSKANQAKGSGSAAYVPGSDPNWVRDQVQLEDTTRERLQNMISTLASISQ